MGLDLTLEAVPAASDIDYKVIEKCDEICYGRKTWFIWNWFRFCGKAEVLPNAIMIKMTREAWDTFIDILNQKKSLIEKYLETVYYYDDMIALTDIYINIINEQMRHEPIIKEFEEWYDKTFYDTPTLGYSWDARAMLDWLAAADEVREKIDDPSYVVLLIADY